MHDLRPIERNRETAAARNGDVQFPIAHDAFEREAGIPPEVGKQQQGGQRDGLLLGQNREAKRRKTPAATLQVTADCLRYRNTAKAARTSMMLSDFGPAGQVG